MAVCTEAAQTSPQDHSIAYQQQLQSQHHELGISPAARWFCSPGEYCHAYFHVYVPFFSYHKDPTVTIMA